MRHPNKIMLVTFLLLQLMLFVWCGLELLTELKQSQFVNVCPSVVFMWLRGAFRARYVTIRNHLALLMPSFLFGPSLLFSIFLCKHHLFWALFSSNLLLPFLLRVRNTINPKAPNFVDFHSA